MYISISTRQFPYTIPMKATRDSYFLMETKMTAWQQFCDNQGGGKGPLFKTAASCLYEGTKLETLRF
jgi:hypothetical protein